MVIPQRFKDFGVFINKTFDRDLLGRFASPRRDEDAAVFSYLCSLCEGPYLEIGVLWGGSMIIAGLMMPDVQLYGIDPLFGYDKPGKLDPFVKLDYPTSVRVVERNLEKFDMLDRAHLFVHKHPPFPEILEDAVIEIAFIDGDHHYDSVMADWLALKDRVSKMIIFHDLHHRDPPKVFINAAGNPDWSIFYEGISAKYSRMGALVREGYLTDGWLTLNSPKLNDGK